MANLFVCVVYCRKTIREIYVRGKGGGIEARVDLKSLSSSSFLFGGWKFSDSFVCFDLAQNEISAWPARPFAAACHQLGRFTKGGFDNKRNRRIREHSGAARRFCLAEKRSRRGRERKRENYKRKRKCVCVCMCVRARLSFVLLFGPFVCCCSPFTADIVRSIIIGI